MNKREIKERAEFAQERVSQLIGDDQFLAVIPGTGWRQGLVDIFQTEESIDYDELGIPKSDATLEGHSKTLEIGTINGRKAMKLGRVHANESTNEDLPQAVRVVIEAVQNNLEGLIITQGVGSLHGRVGQEQGLIKSLVRTAIIDTVGWAIRGKRVEPIRVGDLVVLDNFRTLSLGQYTPLVGGEFIDFVHNGIHRDNDQYFNIGKNAIQAVQGYAPEASYYFIGGPQFEPTEDKLAARLLGADVIGMSALSILTATELDIPFVSLNTVTNGAFDPHSHLGNQEMGDKNAHKTSGVLVSVYDDWPKKQA